MPHTPGKFSIDRNLTRWSLLNGILTRKGPNDGPTDWKELPVRDITALEETTFKTAKRLPLSWPAVFVGIGLLVVAIALNSLPVRVVAAALGIFSIVWGARRISPIITVHQAYRVIAPGINPEEWTIVGVTPETRGFLEALKAEFAQKRELTRS
jgi:hypothetical protein